MYESDSRQPHLHVVPPHYLVHLPNAYENDQAVDWQTILTVRAYVTAKSLSKVCFIRTTATKLNCGQEGWAKAKRDLDLTPHPNLTGRASSLSVLVFYDGVLCPPGKPSKSNCNLSLSESSHQINSWSRAKIAMQQLVPFKDSNSFLFWGCTRAWWCVIYNWLQILVVL